MGYLQDAAIDKINKGKEELIINNIDFTASLPDELLIKIFQYLSTIKELLIMAQVNSRWCRLAAELLTRGFLRLQTFSCLYFSKNSTDPFHNYQHLFIPSKDKKLLMFDKNKLKKIDAIEKIKIVKYTLKYKNSIFNELPKKLNNAIENTDKPITLWRNKAEISVPIVQNYSERTWWRTELAIELDKEKKSFFEEIEKSNKFYLFCKHLSMFCNAEISGHMAMLPCALLICGGIAIWILGSIVVSIMSHISSTKFPDINEYATSPQHNITYYLTPEASEEYEHDQLIQANILLYAGNISAIFCCCGGLITCLLCILRPILAIVGEASHNSLFGKLFNFYKLTPAMLENGESSSSSINADGEEMEPLLVKKKKP